MLQQAPLPIPLIDLRLLTAKSAKSIPDESEHFGPDKLRHLRIRRTEIIISASSDCDQTHTKPQFTIVDARFVDIRCRFSNMVGR